MTTNIVRKYFSSSVVLDSEYESNSGLLKLRMLLDLSEADDDSRNDRSWREMSFASKHLIRILLST